MLVKCTQWGIKRSRDGAILSPHYLFFQGVHGKLDPEMAMRLFANKGQAEREIYRMNLRGWADDILLPFEIECSFDFDPKPYVGPKTLAKKDLT